MFEKVIELYDEYYRKLDQEKAHGFNRALASEARVRLLQLDYLIEKIRDADTRSQGALKRMNKEFQNHVLSLKEKVIDTQSVSALKHAKMTKEEMEESEKAAFEIRIFSESFYYLAGRLRTILRNKGKPVPGLETFECAGARNVRNKLLEHPEGDDSKIFVQSMSWGGHKGPVIKAVREAKQKDIFPDQGLYPNAEEIRSTLDQLLKLKLGKKTNTD